MSTCESNAKITKSKSSCGLGLFASEFSSIQRYTAILSKTRLDHGYHLGKNINDNSRMKSIVNIGSSPGLEENSSPVSLVGSRWRLITKKEVVSSERKGKEGKVRDDRMQGSTTTVLQLLCNYCSADKSLYVNTYTSCDGKQIPTDESTEEAVWLWDDFGR